VLVDERAQNVIVAREQVINIGWWVVDKWRLQKIVSKTVLCPENATGSRPDVL